MRGMLIMVAGPYRSGAEDAAARRANLERLNRAALGVFERGHTPLIAVNDALPLIAAAGDDRYDEIMIPLSRALAARCDAVLRLEGRSNGADEEVAVIVAKGGIVYRALEELPLVDDAESVS